MLLKLGGFDLKEVYGSYALDPFEAGSDKLIAVAEHRPNFLNFSRQMWQTPDEFSSGVFHSSLVTHQVLRVKIHRNLDRVRPIPHAVISSTSL